MIRGSDGADKQIQDPSFIIRAQYCPPHGLGGGAGAHLVYLTVSAERHRTIKACLRLLAFHFIFVCGADWARLFRGRARRTATSRDVSNLDLEQLIAGQRSRRHPYYEQSPCGLPGQVTIITQDEDSAVTVGGPPPPATAGLSLLAAALSTFQRTGATSLIGLCRWLRNLTWLISGGERASWFMVTGKHWRD